MKRTANTALGAITLLLLAAIVPVAYIEGGCRGSMPGYAPAMRYRAAVEPAERRREAATWLTYPEWHIVYSADSYARHLKSAPPSSYGYWNDVRNFWSSYCLVNRVTADMGGAGEYKTMVYTIGFSFTVEMLIKAVYENTIGRMFEWISGVPSGDDLYAATIQRRYANFMRHTPWYRYPFGAAFKGLWKTDSGGHILRHWERRFALSAEYGVKAGYAKAIDLATGATLGRDQTKLRMVVGASPGQLRAIDPRLRVVRGVEGGVVVESPRYAAFTKIVQRMVDRGIPIREIAGNDDIFVTFLMPRPLDTSQGVVLMTQPLGDGARLRVGVSTKVTSLGPLIRTARAEGGALEHVYDY